MEDQGQPSDGEIAFASQVSDLLLNELVAALFQEFQETTPENVERGKQAISLIFNDLNREIRLVGTFEPQPRRMGRRARPAGADRSLTSSRVPSGSRVGRRHPLG